jgi:AcrR family transcriptional regulator
MNDYHHGHLAEAVLARAAELIAADGPYALSLRALAADLGVSHTAPRHHFGSREGVLNALAAQGFRWLAASLAGIREGGGTFLDVGVGYVDFAVRHPAHFQVMFTSNLLDDSDPELDAASRAAFAELTGGVAALDSTVAVEDSAAAVVAGWALVHGIATLALSGNLDSSGVRVLLDGGDLLEITRRSGRMLFRDSPDRTLPSEGNA